MWVEGRLRLCVAAGQQELKVSNELIPKVTSITLNNISQNISIYMETGDPTGFRKQIFPASLMCSFIYIF